MQRSQLATVPGIHVHAMLDEHSRELRMSAPRREMQQGQPVPEKKGEKTAP